MSETYSSSEEKEEENDIMSPVTPTEDKEVQEFYDKLKKKQVVSENPKERLYNDKIL